MLSLQQGEPSRKGRVFLLVIASIESFLLSGVIFGWAPLQTLLLQEGQYKELCQLGHNSAGPCPEQVKRLSYIFGVGSSVFALVVLPTGFFLERFGPLRCFAAGASAVVAGSVAFAFSDSQGPDLFIFAYSLMALGGPAIVSSCMHLSAWFPTRKGEVVALLNIMLDVGPLIFASFEAVHRTLQLGHEVLFLGFAGVGAIALATSPLLWPSQPFTEESFLLSPEPPSTGSKLGTVVKSCPFVLAAAYTAVQMARINYMILTVETQAGHWSDTLGLSGVYRDTLLYSFGWVMPITGVVFYPVVSYVIQSRGVNASVWILSVIGVAYSAFTLVDNFWVICLSYIFCGLFRGFTFSVMSAHVAQVFDPPLFTQLWGIAFAIAAGLNLSVIAAVVVAEDGLNSSYFYTNVGVTGLGALAFAFPLFLSLQKPDANLYRGHEDSWASWDSGVSYGLLNSSDVD